MTDVATISMANTLAIWKARRGSKGRIVTEADLRQQIAARWPALAEPEVAAVLRQEETRRR